jgi:hypothetical protein
MSACERLESGDVDLYFYEELSADLRASMERHVASCGDCRHALDELSVIRSALAGRPVVSAPPAGDWRAFMRRLEEAIDLEMRAKDAAPPAGPVMQPPRHVLASRGYLAMAALLALVAMSLGYVVSVSRGRERAAESGSVQTQSSYPADTPLERSPEKAFAALSERHFERSKLVVLGIANKDPRRASEADWEYERQLASSLLTDTRLYRLAAEERGMRAIATVMGDLELVLLQTSLGSTSTRQDLEQIQRTIQKRDLVTKMDVAF